MSDVAQSKATHYFFKKVMGKLESPITIALLAAGVAYAVYRSYTSAGPKTKSEPKGNTEPSTTGAIEGTMKKKVRSLLRTWMDCFNIYFLPMGAFDSVGGVSFCCRPAVPARFDLPPNFDLLY